MGAALCQGAESLFSAHGVEGKRVVKTMNTLSRLFHRMRARHYLRRAMMLRHTLAAYILEEETRITLLVREAAWHSAQAEPRRKEPVKPEPAEAPPPNAVIVEGFRHRAPESPKDVHLAA